MIVTRGLGVPSAGLVLHGLGANPPAEEEVVIILPPPTVISVPLDFFNITAAAGSAVVFNPTYTISPSATATKEPQPFTPKVELLTPIPKIRLKT